MRSGLQGGKGRSNTAASGPSAFVAPDLSHIVRVTLKWKKCQNRQESWLSKISRRLPHKFFFSSGGGRERSPWGHAICEKWGKIHAHFRIKCKNTQKAVSAGDQKNVIKMTMYVVFVEKKASALLSFLHEKEDTRFSILKCVGQRKFWFFFGKIWHLCLVVKKDGLGRVWSFFFSFDKAQCS